MVFSHTVELRCSDVCPQKQQQHDIHIIVEMRYSIEEDDLISDFYETIKRDRQLNNNCNNINLIPVHTNGDGTYIKVLPRYLESDALREYRARDYSYDPKRLGRGKY